MSKKVIPSSSQKSGLLSEQSLLEPIKTNLIQQNCFVRLATRESESKVGSIETYVSLDEVITPSGVEIKETVNSYPITPSYVNSFVDASDYHNDPMGAIAQSVPRQNLGDVTEYQKVSEMDPTEALSLYKQLQARFGEAVKQPVPDSASSKEGE